MSGFTSRKWTQAEEDFSYDFAILLSSFFALEYKQFFRRRGLGTQRQDVEICPGCLPHHARSF